VEHVEKKENNTTENNDVDHEPEFDDTDNVIRIKPMILEFCPDLSQRVKPDRNSSNNGMTIP
jgi:hypothetical protein